MPTISRIAYSQFLLVPEHSGIPGNEEPGECGRKGSDVGLGETFKASSLPCDSFFHVLKPLTT